MFHIEYEFTGEEIIERRGGRVKKQLRISDIIEIKSVLQPHQMIVRTPGSEMKVLIFPDLKAAIQKEWEQDLANMTDSERARVEKITSDTVSRVKRVNIIGALIFVVIGLVIAFVLGVMLKGKR